MTEQAYSKTVRNLWNYKPTSADIIYIAVGIFAIGAVGVTIWSIHTYIGWWNVFYAFLALAGLAFVLKSAIIDFIDDWLGYDRREDEEIIDQRLTQHSECLDYCTEEDEKSKPNAAPSDKTDKAEDMLLWAIAVTVPAFMLYGWWEERTFFALGRFVVATVLSGCALWWFMTYRSKHDPN